MWPGSTGYILFIIFSDNSSALHAWADRPELLEAVKPTLRRELCDEGIYEYEMVCLPAKLATIVPCEYGYAVHRHEPTSSLVACNN